MSERQLWEAKSSLSSLIPSLEGVVDALSEDPASASLGALHDFLDNDLQPSLRSAGRYGANLEAGQESALMVTLLTRDIADMRWYVTRIESTLVALELGIGSSSLMGRSLVSLFVRLLSVAEVAAATEVEISRRLSTCECGKSSR